MNYIDTPVISELIMLVRVNYLVPVLYEQGIELTILLEIPVQVGLVV